MDDHEAEIERLARFLCHLDVCWADPDADCCSGEPLRVPNGYILQGPRQPLWMFYRLKARDIMEFLARDNDG